MNELEYMKQLIDELNAASNVYYSGDAELISDHEWDAKFDELKALEDKTGIILDNSPTHNVSYDDNKSAKIKHEFPALSLPKSKNVDDLIKYADNRPVNLSWKLDGLTLVVTYDNGKLTRIVTRGNGETGNDITHLASAINNILPEISCKSHIVIRGEAVISYNDFDIVNKIYDNIYENPRNLAAGSCNPKTTVDLIADRHIKWIPFSLVYIDQEINSWYDRMQFLKSLGFDTVDFEKIDNSLDIPGVVSKWSDRVHNFEYPVDGLVITYDDFIYASSGKSTGHHDTRGGFAFKWTDEEATSVLKDIEWSVSINSINPVAVFDPVRLEGTTVERASLCNISECKRLGIGSRDTELVIIKANKIIPKVIKAVKHGELQIPDKCPVCNHPTNIVTSESGVETLVCSNSDCAAKNMGRMSRFVSKYGFDINGLSDKKLEDLVNKNLITNMSDILKLIDKEADVYAVLSDAEGWGQKSIDNMLKAIRDSKNIQSDKFLYALCIPTCGKQVAKDLMMMYNISDIDKIDIIDISRVIGDVKAKNFVLWFENPDNKKLFDELCSICNIKDLNKSDVHTLDNKTFVITGSLNHFESRDALKEYIESCGGKVSGSVSAKTTYLINNDINSTSSKNKKAKSLGINIITEDEFINLVKGE